MHNVFLVFMSRTLEMFCSVRWALLPRALLEWADARTGRADLPWSVPGMHSLSFACYWKVFCWISSNANLDVMLARNGTVLVPWYVVL
jgi:hypothetical protein